VIGICLSEALLSLFPEKNEGYLAKQLSFFACKEVMANLAAQINLVKYLILSKGERSAGKVSDTIMGDALESLFGAIYMDGGFEAAKKSFAVVWTQKLEDETSFENLESKSNLQEWAQSKGYDLPLYEVLDIIGPDHAPTFYVEVQVAGKSCFADGPSKKAAEQSAAKKFLEKLSAQAGNAA
jgi:ribonuclease-3